MTDLKTGLNPSRRVLGNGVRVLMKRSTTTPAVTVYVSTDCGSVVEPPDRAGLAHFLSRTIDRGTHSRSAEQIAEALDGWGVSLQTSATRHSLAVACTCLVEDFAPVMALVADIVREPAFPQTEVERRRSEILTLLQQDEDSTAAVASQACMAMLFGDGHPYGRPVRGTAEVVKSVDRLQLQAFHGAHVRPAGTCVAVVGDVAPEAALAAVQRAFGDWPQDGAPRVELGQALPGALSMPALPPSTSRRVRVVPMMNKSQVDVAYGFVGLKRRDPGYYAYWLMNTVLGEYALGGRLGDNIRERQGMAYYVSSAIGSGPIEGPLLIRAGVSGDDVPRAIEAIDAEIDLMAANGPREAEVEESKSYLIGSLPRLLETNIGIAEYLQSVEFDGLGMHHDVELPGLLRQVTREDVHEAARRVLNSARAAVAVAGPFDGAQA